MTGSAPKGSIRVLSEESAAQLTEAVWPWVVHRRWSPVTSDTDPQAEPVIAWELPLADETEGAAGHERPLVLVVRAPSTGALLQVPLVRRRRENVGAREDSERAGFLGGDELWDGALESVFWSAWTKQAEIVSGTRAGLLAATRAVRPLGKEQSNSSVVLHGSAEPLIAKVYRVLHPGKHPEVELPGALTRAGWPGTPALRAMWDLPPDAAGLIETCSAVVSVAIAGAEDGFDLFVGLAKANADPRQQAEALGLLTAEMHRELLQELGPKATITSRTIIDRTQQALEDMASLQALDPQVLSDLLTSIQSRLDATRTTADVELPTQRVHGDYHLGQTLHSPQGKWFVIDFEGEPIKNISERTLPDVRLRDVAGMLRSFDYAWHKGGRQDGRDTWIDRARTAFLETYVERIGLNDDDLALLQLLEIEKALYEVQYEANFRPDHLEVPLAALERLSQSSPQPTQRERL